MIKTKIVSSLEKAMLEERIEKFTSLKKLTALRGERISFQLLNTFEYTDDLGIYQRNIAFAKLTAEGELVKYATFREVGNVPVERPTLEKAADDDDYISKRPGLFPDILRPLRGGNIVCATPFLTTAVWVEINIPEDFTAGEYEFKINLDAADKGSSESSVVIEVIDAVLPKEDIKVTQWFHCDSLAHYYNVEAWSERHWEIIENFAKTAVKNGINMLITPVFTLPLDTAPGGERLTTQLVGVTKNGNEYSFDFSLLERWIEMCDRVGIKYFEISHLFTQWGAEHAPKVMATVDGEYKRIFGWETDAVGEEYKTFLRAFLTEFIAYMKKRGDDKRCHFHISDEPHFSHIENYKAARESIIDIIKDYPTMDAMSNFDFWQLGLITTPVPSTNKIAPFLEAKIPNLWAYYCCSQFSKVSNRFIAMTSARNRSIGFQMYKYNIVGFLQWGYNFYANYHSIDQINPYLVQDGAGWVSPGDAFSVYPAQNGEALESLRIIVFHEALQDIKAMKLLESYIGKEAVVKLIDEAIGTNVTFDTCARKASQILSLREKVNELIKANVTK